MFYVRWLWWCVCECVCGGGGGGSAYLSRKTKCNQPQKPDTLSFDTPSNNVQYIFSLMTAIDILHRQLFKSEEFFSFSNSFFSQKNACK